MYSTKTNFELSYKRLSSMKNGKITLARAETVDRTGVEMEALTAVSVACLTVYDMCKSADRAMTIEGIALWEKSGGRSGVFRRSNDGDTANPDDAGNSSRNEQEPGNTFISMGMLCFLRSKIGDKSNLHRIKRDDSRSPNFLASLGLIKN